MRAARTQCPRRGWSWPTARPVVNLAVGLGAVLALSHCHSDIGVDTKRFACQASTDCTAGYGCQPVLGRCMTLNALAAYAQVTSPDRVNVQGGGKIDRTEVTARMYAECVNFGACPVPKCAGSALPAAYDDNYPVACVDFSAAQSYCQFAGARLPTDAEWNLAAHGSGGSEFPWGTAAPSCVQANIHVDAGDGCGTGRAAPAGDRPAGASASGAVNLFGNVAEWVDWSPGDPKTTPSDRPIKGGSYNSTADELAKLKSGAYQVAGQTEQQPTIGFRCFAP